MKKAFLDTNVLIAWVFLINSIHHDSGKVFKAYSEFFWSNFVKDEFDQCYGDKLDGLLDFFRDLQKFFDNPEKEFYSIKDLFKYAEKQYGDELDDVISSINPFWNEYLGIESQIFFSDMKTAISHCLKDLTMNTDINKQYIEGVMQLTPSRIKEYSNIDKMLESNGVHETDRVIVLDGHDFSCYSYESIDFVTFDTTCYNGAKNIGLLCFSSIKGKYDFN